MNSLNFGETGACNTASWQILCWDLEQSLPCGALVTTTIGDRLLYGLVIDQSIHTDHASHSMASFALPPAQLRQQHPEIFAFLKRTARCIAVGYQYENGVLHVLPPEPPRPHAFVQLATSEQVRLFFQCPDFLSILFAQQEIANIDELLLAILVRLKEQQLLEQFIEPFIEQYSLLIGNDYRRLKLFLQRAERITI